MHIHFVAKEKIARQIWEPVLAVAQLRGHRVSLSENPWVEADIGFYCDDKSFPGRQTLTVITRNGLDQDHDVQTEPWLFFERENWGLFDLGLVPGPFFARQARTAAEKTLSVPKLGVLQAGWPKAESLRLPGNAVSAAPFPAQETVFYAPNIECDGKQRKLIDLMDGSGRKLLIKHWELPAEAELYPGLLTASYFENLDRENEYARQFGWVEVLPPESNFMDHIRKAHLLVSDQSSVLLEALFFGVPTISVKDWRHNCGESCKAKANICVLSTQASLARDIDKIFSRFLSYVSEAEKLRDDMFSDIGVAAEAFLDSALAAHELKKRIVLGRTEDSTNASAEATEKLLRQHQENEILRLENYYLKSANAFARNLGRPLKRLAARFFRPDDSRWNG